jgi:hypothetical protein
LSASFLNHQRPPSRRRAPAWPPPRARPASSRSTLPSDAAARRRRGGPSARLSLTRWSSRAPGLRAALGRRGPGERRPPPAAALHQGAHSVPVQVRASAPKTCCSALVPVQVRGCSARKTCCSALVAIRNAGALLDMQCVFGCDETKLLVCVWV